jgi:hypothetical protein
MYRAISFASVATGVPGEPLPFRLQRRSAVAFAARQRKRECECDGLRAFRRQAYESILLG